MKITIRKIAEIAGVSRGTVDKVVHKREGVSDEVRAHVQSIIDKYDYAPNHPEKAAVPSVPQKNYVIAVIMPALTNQFFVNIKKGMDNALKKIPGDRIRLEYFPYGGGNVSEILSILEYLRERGVDGLAIRGVQNGRLCEQLNLFNRRRIPVVLLDSDVSGAKRLCMVSEDSYRSGRVAATLLAKSIGESGDVDVIGSSPEIENNRLRIQGFSDAIREKYEDITIINNVNSLDQSVIAYEQTALLVERYPKLAGIFNAVGCAGDIGRALIDWKGTKIKLVSYNFTPDVISLIKHGIVDFAIGLSPEHQGTLVIELLSDYLLYGKKPPDKVIQTPILIGMDENIDILAEDGVV